MIDEKWALVRSALTTADSIAWDGCHKIYIQMDADQTKEVRSYGYDPVIAVRDIGVEKALETLKEWYEESCGLRFVYSVRTVTGDPNAGYDRLIEQFEWEDEG